MDERKPLVWRRIGDDDRRARAAARAALAARRAALRRVIDAPAIDPDLRLCPLRSVLHQILALRS